MYSFDKMPNGHGGWEFIDWDSFKHQKLCNGMSEDERQNLKFWKWNKVFDQPSWIYSRQGGARPCKLFLQFWTPALSIAKSITHRKQTCVCFVELHPNNTDPLVVFD